MNQRFKEILCLLGLAALFFFLREHYPSLAKLFLILGGITALGVAVLVITVIVFAFRKSEKTTEQQKAEAVAPILQKGRTQLMEVRKLTTEIKNPEIRKVSESICSIVDKILHTLKKQPDDVPRLRKVFSSCLPTLQGVLAKYILLESSDHSEKDTAAKTLFLLQDLESSVEKQYLSLFGDDEPALSAKIAEHCKRDGLLADSCQLPEDSSTPPGFPGTEAKKETAPLFDDDFEPSNEGFNFPEDLGEER